MMQNHMPAWMRGAEAEQVMDRIESVIMRVEDDILDKKEQANFKA